MKKNARLLNILWFAVIVAILGCNRNKIDENDLTLSQNDINLLLKHKKNIDRITVKYDRELLKTQGKMKNQIIENGKTEIDSYLKSNNLNPTVFMRKSKKILKGYLAFYETGPESLEKKIKLLESQNLTEKKFNEAVSIYNKLNDDLFKEYTAELSDYEIELIKMNMKSLSSVIKN